MPHLGELLRFSAKHLLEPGNIEKKEKIGKSTLIATIFNQSLVCSEICQIWCNVCTLAQTGDGAPLNILWGTDFHRIREQRHNNKTTATKKTQSACINKRWRPKQNKGR